jgi:hypothetical protein
MSIKSKTLGSLLVLFSIIGILIIPSITNGQVTNYYSNNTEINPIAFTLTISNPIDQSTYSKSLPLQVNLIWNISLDSMLADHQPVKEYAYCIDHNPLVNITPNGSLAWNSYWFSYSIDISNLTQGNHRISVIAYQYYNNSFYQGLFNQSSTPITFLVDNTLPLTSPTLSPTPTPTVPEFSWLAILPLFLFMLSIAVVFRHQKTSKLNQLTFSQASVFLHCVWCSKLEQTVSYLFHE